MYEHVHPSRLANIKAAEQAVDKHNISMSKAAYRKQGIISSSKKQTTLRNRKTHRRKQQPLRINLFHLPRELRDLIYHHAWNYTTLIFYQKTGFDELENDTSSPYQHGPLMIVEYSEKSEYTYHSKEAWSIQHPCGCRRRAPARQTWIWTCRQLFVQVTEQFYRHAQLTRLPVHKHTPAIRGVPQRVIDRSKLLFPYLSLARRISINMEESNSWIKINHCASSCSFNDGLRQVLVFLCSSVATRGSLYVHVKKCWGSEVHGRFYDGSTKSEETKIRELRHRGWKIKVKKEDGVVILEVF